MAAYACDFLAHGPYSLTRLQACKVTLTALHPYSVTALTYSLRSLHLYGLAALQRYSLQGLQRDSLQGLQSYSLAALQL